MTTDCVKKFIEQYYIKRFLCVNMEEDRNKVPEPTSYTAGYKDAVNHKTYFYIFPKVFINEVCDGLDHKEVLKELRDKDLIKHDEGMYTLTVDLNKWRKSQKVIAISHDILDPWFPHVYYQYKPQ